MATATRLAPGSTPDRAAPDRREALAFVGAMAVLMWFVEVLDAIAFNLDQYGIEPRDLEGLSGIIFAPFLHAGFGHLIGNTIPFLLLGAVIAVGGLARVAVVTLIIAAVGGLGTWLVAPEGTIHIGASGIVFGYATYLLTRGFFSRSLWHWGMGLIVLLVYGSTLLFGLVPTPGVSWQGHFFGGVGGIIAARAIHARRDGRSAP
jgi:membrane associated rhomboid family serine protease